MVEKDSANGGRDNTVDGLRLFGDLEEGRG